MSAEDARIRRLRRDLEASEAAQALLSMIMEEQQKKAAALRAELSKACEACALPRPEVPRTAAAAAAVAVALVPVGTGASGSGSGSGADSVSGSGSGSGSGGGSSGSSGSVSGSGGGSGYGGCYDSTAKYGSRAGTRSAQATAAAAAATAAAALAAAAAAAGAVTRPEPRVRTPATENAVRQAELKQQALLERVLPVICGSGGTGVSTVLAHLKRIADSPDGKAMVLTYLLKDGGEPGRGVHEGDRMLAAVGSDTTMRLAICPEAVATFGNDVEMRRTRKEAAEDVKSPAGRGFCTGDALRFAFAVASDESRLLSSPDLGALTSNGLHSRSVEHCIDQRNSSNNLYLYGAPFDRPATRTSDPLTCNGLDALSAVKTAICACGPGVAALFNAADIDGDQSRVFPDDDKATQHSLYCNSGGEHTYTHLDTMHSNESKPSGVSKALRNAGIPPMQRYTDGVVDGLDSLNAVPGNGQPVGGLP